MNLGTITARIKEFLEPCDHITIEHKLSLNGPYEKLYDIEVEVEYPYAIEIMPFLSQKVVIDEKKEQVCRIYILSRF